MHYTLNGLQIPRYCDVYGYPHAPGAHGKPLPKLVEDKKHIRLEHESPLQINLHQANAIKSSKASESAVGPKGSLFRILIS